jgi:hypothetical protein
VQYGESTGDGNEDAVLVASGEDAETPDTGLEVRSRDGEGGSELRPSPQAPLIATHEEQPATFIVALDESLLG